MGKLIKGLMKGAKKFFKGMYLAIIKAGAGLGGKKKDKTK